MDKVESRVRVRIEEDGHISYTFNWGEIVEMNETIMFVLAEQVRQALGKPGRAITLDIKVLEQE